MALASTTVWEVRTTGNDVNGGGFNASRDAVNGVDYSQQDSAQLSLTDLACASNTTLTSVTGGFTHAMEGNLIYIASGTNAVAGYYEITTYTNTNTVTIDRTCATGGDMSSGVGKVGGALGSPGKLTDGLTVSGMNAWIKSGTYTLTTATPGAAGPISLGATVKTKIEAYQTSRGDMGAQAVLDGGAVTSATFVTLASGASSAPQTINGVKCDGKSGTGNNGFSLISSALGFCRAYKCEAINFNATTTTYGFKGGYAIECEADTCGVGFDLSSVVGCVAHHCSGNGIQPGYTAMIAACDSVSYANTGDGFRGLNNITEQIRQIFVRCTAYGNGGDGFEAGDGTICIACAAEANSGYGYNSELSWVLIACASYNNTSGRVVTGKEPQMDVRSQAATASMFTSSTDFRPNSTASAGALLRGAGVNLPDQTDNGDIGAVQHADPAGGASPRFGDRTGGLR